MDELRTRSSLLKVKAATLLLLTLLSCTILSCSQSDKNRISDLPESAAAFWGDSSAIFIAKNPQNGYRISILNNKEMTLAHFERGDSISRFALLEQLPDCLSDYEEGSIGIFSVDINIPVVKVDTLGGSKTPQTDIFFMDVNFDGEEELLQAISGNGWVGYTCYDLVHGFGQLGPMLDEPFNLISYGIEPMQDGYTVFDYQKREIFIHHGSGCCAFDNTWAKYIEGDSQGHQTCVKVIKEERHSFDAEYENIETYELKDDALKLTSKTKRKY